MALYAQTNQARRTTPLQYLPVKRSGDDRNRNQIFAWQYLKSEALPTQAIALNDKDGDL